MPTVKIKDLPKKFTCRNKDHSPNPDPDNLETGVYEHTCPECGNKTRFNIYPTKFRQITKW